MALLATGVNVPACAPQAVPELAGLPASGRQVAEVRLKEGGLPREGISSLDTSGMVESMPRV